MTLSEQRESKSRVVVWYVYIAVTPKGRYYVGISTNPDKRLKLHNKGLGAKLARDQGGFKIVYVSEPMLNQSDARFREIQIKGWTRLKKEKLISGEWK